MAKRKAKKKRNRRKGRAGSAGSPRVRVELCALEIAKGHDGLLRGAPEPVILLGAYLVGPSSARLVARAACRSETPARIPGTVKPRSDDQIDARIDREPGLHVVVLGLAVEEDNGAGVQSLFADLERAEQLTMWPRDSTIPTPVQIDEIPGDGDEWLQPRRVHLSFDGQEMSSRCVGDDWVDASALVLPTGSIHAVHPRMHFCAEDGRNDWTAELIAKA